MIDWEDVAAALCLVALATFAEQAFYRRVRKLPYLSRLALLAQKSPEEVRIEAASFAVTQLKASLARRRA